MSTMSAVQVSSFQKDSTRGDSLIEMQIDLYKRSCDILLIFLAVSLPIARYQGQKKAIL